MLTQSNAALLLTVLQLNVGDWHEKVCEQGCYRQDICQWRDKRAAALALQAASSCKGAWLERDWRAMCTDAATFCIVCGMCVPQQS